LSANSVTDYETKTHVVSAGFNLHPAPQFDLGVSLNWALARASMGRLGLAASPEFLARVTGMSYDFTATPTFSDLDSTNVDLLADATYRVNDRVFVRGAYRYLDYTDDVPYLYDTSGKNNLVYLSLGWAF
jgi:hypothetical protein